MITGEQNLRLQAFVDDELGVRERRQVESWLARDSRARTLAGELQALSQCIAGNEIARPVPEPVGAYWSRISQGIERELAGEEAVRRATRWCGWRRWWLPAAAAALLLVGGFVFLRSVPDPESSAVLAVVDEVETPLREVSSFSFRAESERMTVVWVNFRSD